MIPENTVPPPEMVGMITTIAVKVNPEREDSETRTVRVSVVLLLALLLSTSSPPVEEARGLDFLDPKLFGFS